MLSDSIAAPGGVKSGLRHMAGGKRALNLSFCVLFSQAAAEKSVSSRGGSPGRKGGAGGGQEAFLSDERRRYLLQRTAFRTAWVGLTLIIAVEIPDFLGFMGLIGSACVGMVVFILPVVFDWRLRQARPKNKSKAVSWSLQRVRVTSKR